MIYQHFIKSLVEKNINIDLSNCILIHGGGWKKLVSKSIGTKLRELLYQIPELNLFMIIVVWSNRLALFTSNAVMAIFTLPFILTSL